MTPLTKHLLESILAGQDPSQALEQVLAPKVAAIDLDGTILDNDTPIPGIIDQLNQIKQAGWLIAIWTCRSDDAETKALLDRFAIPYDFINCNPFDEVGGRKLKADCYVDDRAVAFSGSSNDLANRVLNYRPWWDK